MTSKRILFSERCFVAIVRDDLVLVHIDYKEINLRTIRAFLDLINPPQS